MLRSKIFMSLVVSVSIITAIALTTLALQSSAAQAAPQGEIGSYQISSWAAYSGERVHHSGHPELRVAVSFGRGFDKRLQRSFSTANFVSSTNKTISFV